MMEAIVPGFLLESSIENKLEAMADSLWLSLDLRNAVKDLETSHQKKDYILQNLAMLLRNNIPLIVPNLKDDNLENFILELISDSIDSIFQAQIKGDPNEYQYIFNQLPNKILRRLRELVRKNEICLA